MFRRIIVLGLVVALIATLAAVAAVRTSSNEVEAQAAPIELSQLCLDPSTKLYRATFNSTCPPNHQLITLPDDYPITLCSSVYDLWLRAPGANGQCQAPNTARFDLPEDLPLNVCYYPATGLLRPDANGVCPGRGAALLATFPGSFGANDDSYQTLGNIDIDVPAGSGVLANDFGPGIAVTSFQTPSALGGTVSVNPDGSFTYIPPVGVTGVDSFTYDTLDTDGNTDTATVTIEVLAPVVWFVDANASSNGDGSRVAPFNTIESVNDEGADPDAPGDVIFLYESAFPYQTDFLLEEGQHLIGQEVDLGEILRATVEGAALQGRGAAQVLPFMVLPESNPTTDVPLLLSDGDITLLMEDDSTATGVTIDGGELPAVLVVDAENTTLDRVEVYGGTDERFGAPGVVIDVGELTVIDSFITGGQGEGAVIQSASSSSLQGQLGGGNGGDGIFAVDGELTVIGSTVEGGDFEDITPTEIKSEATLQGLDVVGGDGGNGIFIDFFGAVTVTGESTVSGGNGGFSDFEGGEGGDGIQVGDLFSNGISVAGSLNRNLQGRQDPPPEEEIPFITVSGASLVAGGNGGDGFDTGGDGGNGIASAFFVVTVSEGSTVIGGNGGSSQFDGGFGGNGIAMGTPDVFRTQSAPTLMGLDIPEELTVLSVDASFVHGGNGGEAGDFAGWGGGGISALFLPISLGLEGPSLQGDIMPTATFIANITGSEITGGNGADSLINGLGAELQSDVFGVAGDGGTGIGFLALTGRFFGSESTLQGPGLPFDVNFDINITSSQVDGGAGGVGPDSGWGGLGIANGFPLFLPGYEDRQDRRGSNLQGGAPFEGANLTIIDSVINAGAAADSEGFSGSGGIGVITVGSFFSGPVDDPKTTTISNSAVNGGDGGSSSDEAGSGGEGVVALGVNLLVDQGSQITAGNGGNGGFGAGDGGFGIVSESSTVMIDASTVSGGTGGNGDEAGLGGEAIAVYDTELTVSNGSQVTGGSSGAATIQSAPGGDGVLADVSTVTISDSTVNGGAGSAGTGIDGESGGHGVHVIDCIECFTLTITNSTVTGGDGGGSDQTGGDGGEGVMIENDNATITGSTITGGDGVDGGEGAVAVEFDQEDDGSYILVLTGNTLVGGTDGNGQQSDSLFVQQDSFGSVCMDASGNIPTGGFELDNGAGTGMLGITQASVAALSADNNGVAVDPSGTITTGCSTSTSR